MEGPGGGPPDDNNEDSDGQDADGQLPQRVCRQGPVLRAGRAVAQRHQPPRLAKNKGKKSTRMGRNNGQSSHCISDVLQ